MKVLMITGDKNMLIPGTEAFSRAELQRTQVAKLQIFFWGRGGISVWRIFFTALKEHFDVITAQDPFWRGHIAWHLARLTGARVQLQVHTDLRAYGFLKRTLARFHLRRADSIRVVSEEVKKQLLGMGVHAPIIVLPVFVDISTFKNVVRHAHDGKNILWIGRFEEEKNPLQAIEVLKEVLKVEPTATLTMLGKGSLGQQVTAAAANSPVTLPGWQDPVIFLETADVVLCTSVHESWGASIVEALAAGVPVVAPDVGIAKEAGAIVVPRTQLAGAIVKILNSDEKGALKISMPGKAEWAYRWKETLQ